MRFIVDTSKKLNQPNQAMQPEALLADPQEITGRPEPICQQNLLARLSAKKEANARIGRRPEEASWSRKSSRT